MDNDEIETFFLKGIFSSKSLVAKAAKERFGLKLAAWLRWFWFWFWFELELELELERKSTSPAADPSPGVLSPDNFISLIP